MAVKKTHQVTIVGVEDELLRVLKERAKINRRSLSSEVLYLIECGMAAKSSTLVELTRLMAKIDKASIETT